MLMIYSVFLHLLLRNKDSSKRDLYKQDFNISSQVQVYRFNLIKDLIIFMAPFFHIIKTHYGMCRDQSCVIMQKARIKHS